MTGRADLLQDEVCEFEFSICSIPIGFTELIY